MSLYLVTTADERSWPKKDNTSFSNEPVIFLGEWCKNPERKEIWSSMNALVSEPYGLNPEQKIRDNDEKHRLYNTLIKELASKLNDFHHTSHSTRYWTILIGPWLNNYILIVLNRYKALEVVLEKFDISKTILLNLKGFQLVRNDYLDYRRAIHTDLWNNLLYVDILKDMKSQDIEILYKDIDSPVIHDNIRQSKNIINFFSKEVIFKIFNFLQVFSRDTDPFIIKSYLPIFSELRLKILLGQFPLILKTPVINYDFLQEDKVDRKNFFLEYANFKGAERQLRRLVNKLIPKIYIEGYESACNQASLLKWPSKPKFIYTANNFTADEIFKFWVGSKVEKGIPYYAGQHGANYGTLYESKNWPELNTVDRFYSWGWENIYKGQKTIPAFNFKIKNSAFGKYNKTGNLFLVETSPGTRDGIRDRFYQNMIAHNDMVELYGLLGKEIQADSIVRLHHRSQDLNAWQEKYQFIKIDQGKNNFSKIIKKSRLIVFNYDSAGLLELIALNVPVIIFTRAIEGSLLPSARPYYQLLKDVGIIMSSPEEVASFIRENWGNIDKWWGSEIVQNAKDKFCKSYSRQVKNPTATLKKLLLEK